MPSAVDKFTQAMNKISDHWAKNIEIMAKQGKITMIRCEGFTWVSDQDEAMGEVPADDEHAPAHCNSGT